jgi:hypothetical protein
LNPAPLWEGERSEYVVLWHGCTLAAKDNIEAGGIDLAWCAADTDFGRGFYTATSRRQARHWAWDRHSKLPAAARDANPPVLLRFRVRRYTRRPRRSWRDDGLDRLAALAFIRGEPDADDYWALVQHCRRSNPTVVRDHGRPPTGWYPMVCGPVAAFWRQRIPMPAADQISFHPGGVGLLDALIRGGKGRGGDGRGDPDYYRWEFVEPEEDG